MRKYEKQKGKEAGKERERETQDHTCMVHTCAQRPTASDPTLYCTMTTSLSAERHFPAHRFIALDTRAHYWRRLYVDLSSTPTPNHNGMSHQQGPSARLP